MGRVTKKYLVGTSWVGKYGDFTILEYVNGGKIKIQFTATGFVKYTDSKGVNHGTVKDPYHPTVAGVGYIGMAVTSGEDKKVKNAYHCWRGMLRRCYEPTSWVKNPTYQKVSVCSEWLCFECYEKWYDIHNIVGFEVDKDLTNVGCNEYSPKNCRFVPSHINAMIGAKVIEGKELPTGVSYHSRDGIYNAKYWDGTRLVHLGDFYCPDEARAVYVDYKTSYMRTVAKISYKKGEISKVIYNNLLNWVV